MELPLLEKQVLKSSGLAGDNELCPGNVNLEILSDVRGELMNGQL